MRQLARQDSRKEAVRSLAEEFPDPVHVDLLFRHSWIVVPDPDNYEFIRAPEYQARLYWKSGYFAGDCDDSATMGAALLCANNWPCWLTAIRRPGEWEFSHVFVSALTDYGQIDIDPIVPEEHLPIRDIAESLRVDV